MIPRERVLTALRRQVPDRVPHCEVEVSRSLADRLMGWNRGPAADEELNPYTVEEAKAVATFLGLDNITFVLRAPTFAKTEVGKDGVPFSGEGLIRSAADLERLQMPDPHDDALYAEAETFARGKGDFSAWLRTRIGISSVMLSMGLERFSVALYDDRSLVERLLDMYTDWITVVRRLTVTNLAWDHN